MFAYRYSHWDGSQEILPMDADELLDAMTDDLLSHGDLWTALQRLFRWGGEVQPGRNIRGLQQLLEQLRAERQKQLERHDLNSVVEEVRKKLQEVLRTERDGIQQRVEEGQQRLQKAHEEGTATPEDEQLQNMLEQIAARKQQFLNELPQDMGGAIKALSDYEFMDDQARQLFQELLQMLQQQVMQSYFQGMQQGIQGLSQEDLKRIRDMVRDLNRMLRQRLDGQEPDFQSFQQKYGDMFPGVNSLDELIQQLQERMAQMQSLLDSMTPEMRQQLQSMMDSLLQDDRLRWDLAQMAAMLEQLYPMRQLRNQYPFQGDEPLTLAEAMQVMEQLQQLDKLERQIRDAQYRPDLSRIDEEAVRRLLGEEAYQDLERLRQLTKILEEAGYIAKKGETFELTPRGIRRIGQKALQDIFAHLKRDRFGKHETKFRGTGGDRSDETKRYEFGDPFLLHLERTLMNSLVREGAGTPVQLDRDDFEIYRTEYLTQSSTVLLLDMSRSMVLRGLFFAAKKVALALHSLIKTQFPRDELYIVVFSAYAQQIKPDDLPQITWNEYTYGTNMQHALMVARQLLGRRKVGTRQAILITDGEPTAHFEGDDIDFSYPPSHRTIQETLKEVGRCTREEIVINTFMLERSPYLTDFVNQMMKINRGRAFFASPDRLGEYILVDYVTNKRKTIR